MLNVYSSHRNSWQCQCHIIVLSPDLGVIDKCDRNLHECLTGPYRPSFKAVSVALHFLLLTFSCGIFFLRRCDEGAEI